MGKVVLFLITLMVLSPFLATSQLISLDTTPLSPAGQPFSETAAPAMRITVHRQLINGVLKNALATIQHNQEAGVAGVAALAPLVYAWQGQYSQLEDEESKKEYRNYCKDSGSNAHPIRDSDVIQTYIRLKRVAIDENKSQIKFLPEGGVGVRYMNIRLENLVVEGDFEETVSCRTDGKYKKKVSFKTTVSYVAFNIQVAQSFRPAVDNSAPTNSRPGSPRPGSARGLGREGTVITPQSLLIAPYLNEETNTPFIDIGPMGFADKGDHLELKNWNRAAKVGLKLVSGLINEGGRLLYKDVTKAVVAHINGAVAVLVRESGQILVRHLTTFMIPLRPPEYLLLDMQGLDTQVTFDSGYAGLCLSEEGISVFIRPTMCRTVPGRAGKRCVKFVESLGELTNPWSNRLCKESFMAPDLPPHTDTINAILTVHTPYVLRPFRFLPGYRTMYTGKYNLIKNPSDFVAGVSYADPASLIYTASIHRKRGQHNKHQNTEEDDSSSFPFQYLLPSPSA